MSNDTFVPPPGSLAWRVCNWFGMSRNREEERTPTELASQFEASRKEVMNALADCASAGLVIYTQGATGYVYRAGPRLDAWVRGESAPTAAPAAPKTAKRGGKRPRLPPLDLSQVKVQAGVPVPPSPAERGATRWRPILEQLDSVGKSVVLPVAYRGSFSKAANEWAKNKGCKFVYRTVDTDKFGAWRTA